jgi:hypothetical protein
MRWEGNKEGISNISSNDYGNPKIELERNLHIASKAKLLSKNPISSETTSTINILGNATVLLLPWTQT